MPWPAGQRVAVPDRWWLPSSALSSSVGCTGESSAPRDDEALLIALDGDGDGDGAASMLHCVGDDLTRQHLGVMQNFGWYVCAHCVQASPNCSGRFRPRVKPNDDAAAGGQDRGHLLARPLLVAELSTSPRHFAILAGEGQGGIAAAASHSSIIDICASTTGRLRGWLCNRVLGWRWDARGALSQPPERPPSR